jgi:undecaprenyl-diphosphatase
VLHSGEAPGPGTADLRAPVVTAPRAATRLLLLIGGACFVPFLVLAVAVARAWPPLTRLDERWSAWAFTFTETHAWFHTLALGATWFGNGATITILTTLAVVGCLLVRRFGLAAWLAVTVAGTALANTAIKHEIERLRPPSANLLAPAEGFAFPSAHAQAATVAYVAIVLVVGWQVLRPGPAARRVSATAVTLVVLAVGLSRVFLGAHWPSDVLGGWLLGAAWVSVATALLQVAQRRHTEGR